LTRGSKETLSSLAKTLSKESFSFVIQGHVCCTEGKIDAIDKKTKERNLSVARAKYVYDYFLEKGIEKSRMSFEGFGHRFPLGGSADKDRRVEIVVSSN
jgi:outer membrane protein OmpA-like peptidoglycan-associated protein